MAKTRALTHSLNVGEVSTLALARVDQERLRLAAETQENIFGKVIGAGQFRSGTGYLGATQSNNRCRLIPFIKSATDAALLELTTGKLRIWSSDALVSRASVSSTVTNGTFGAATGWTLTTTASGVSSIASNRLTMYCPNRGGTALAKQSVTTSSANTAHALRIVIDRGPVTFRCGSTDGGDEYISETELDEGTHSLVFTPTASPYYIQFFTRSDIEVRVSNCTVEAAGTLSLDAPWSESDLRKIRYDQSGDIVFLACSSWQQRKIERRNNNSWSIVKYKANDGPFTTKRTNNVTLTPGALSGNTTLTADRAFFKSTHVGALFKLFHEGQKVVNTLSADSTYTDSIRVSGPTNLDRTVTFTLAGTWTGNLRTQRSSDGADTGFGTTGTSTTTGTGSFDDSITIPMWYRYGFGSSDHTSGDATITITYPGGGGHGIARVVGFTSSTQVDVEVLSPFLGEGATSVWYEGEWSDKRGWPTSVAFHDGRLGFANNDKFWLSESDAYYTFGRDDDEDLTDASAISRSVATSGAVNSVNWMMSLQRLILGTQGAETVARANSFDEPITPSNTQLKDASTQGSAAVTPVRIDKRGAYVQRSGNKVYELFYNFEQQDYDSADLMEMNETIGGDGIVELFVQRQPEPYLWCVRSDGQCPVLLYEAREKVKGWQRFITDGEVESGAVLPGTSEDVVYLAIKRTINGSTVRYVEKLSQFAEGRGGSTSKMADAGTLTAGPATSVTLAHLASETDLVAWATNEDGDQVALTGLSADGSGVIALGGTYSNIWCGLGYRGRYKSAKLAYGGQAGTALLQRKRVGPIGLLLADTHPDAITHGPNFDTLEQMPRIEEATDTGSDVRDVYDEISFPFNGEWDTDSRVCLEVNAPYPATICGIVTVVEVNE